jgi:triphosphoribosyl-dephospho-CoA synthase
MERSVALVRAHLADVAGTLQRGEPLAARVALARAAERRMIARFGTNTHKGALFLGSVVLAARARAACDDVRLNRAALARVAHDLAPVLAIDRTHGAVARARFGVGGILREVEAGLPSVFDVALPAFRAAVARREGGDAPSLRMLAGLMCTVEDTTALHRCGAAGLATLRRDGARLDAVLDAGGAPAAAVFLRDRNAAYREMNLTMGGVADLLGVALGWLTWSGELARR